MTSQVFALVTLHTTRRRQVGREYHGMGRRLSGGHQPQFLATKIWHTSVQYGSTPVVRRSNRSPLAAEAKDRTDETGRDETRGQNVQSRTGK